VRGTEDPGLRKYSRFAMVKVESKVFVLGGYYSNEQRRDTPISEDRLWIFDLGRLFFSLHCSLSKLARGS
jgi:hypothetical protein